jgi:hypothetical protein
MLRPPAGGRPALRPGASVPSRAWLTIVGLSAATPPGRDPVAAGSSGQGMPPPPVAPRAPAAAAARTPAGAAPRTPAGT